ncbi:MAG: NADPH-dependent glutamate synthase [Clostridia bacterium]|nr:NADPH-dependent glutamate synthase [Clostridia bacterium]
MRNTSKKKTKMPHLSPSERIRTFSEVAVGYSEADAIAEASRCLGCKNMPCVSGCPVGIRIPDFIARVVLGDLEGAYEIIAESSTLPGICGRVCPQETQCESKCVCGIKGEPVAIGRLERFVADYHRENAKKAVQKTEKNGIKTAVVGSGPAGLACASELARRGYSVTVYEALHEAGGVLTYGIPEFRLPKAIVKSEVDALTKMGVAIETNVVIGKTLTVDELFDMGYEAVFLGTGAGLPNFCGIPGEALCGVYSANEFLTRVNLMHAYREGASTPIMVGESVAVIGGGNVAMDAARTAKRLGAKSVYIVYRRSEAELPARREEVLHAKEEGVEFMLLSAPTEVLGYEEREDKKFGFVKALRCIKMKLGEPDERGRRRPEEIPGSEFILPMDTVIMSVGTSPNPLITATTEGLSVSSRGCITVTEGGQTSRPGIFAGGDAVTGAATVISAMGAGKAAASAMDEYIKAKKTP